jgi:8-oxo-dGTP diphosphatase
VRPQVVVGVALVRDGQVLAARRPAGPNSPGGWEFPGGKVEPGESDRQAAVREIHEELGLTISVGQSLEVEEYVGDRYLFRVYVGRVVDGDLVLHEHSEVRWLGADQLDDVDWLAADRPFLEPLRRVILRRRGDPSRFGDDYSAR